MPPGILRGAIKIKEVQYFEPNLSGPATNQTRFIGDEDEDKAADAEGEKQSQADTAENENVSGCCRAPDA